MSTTDLGEVYKFTTINLQFKYSIKNLGKREIIIVFSIKQLDIIVIKRKVAEYLCNNLLVSIIIILFKEKAKKNLH